MNAEWGTFGASSFAPAGTFPLAPIASAGTPGTALSPGYVPPGFTPGGIIPGGTPVYPMPVFPTPPGGGYLPGMTTPLPPPGSPLPPPVETLGPHWSETMFAPPMPGQLDPRQVEAMARHQQAAMQAQGQGWGWKGMAAGLAGILLLIGLGYGAWRYTRRKVE